MHANIRKPGSYLADNRLQLVQQVVKGSLARRLLLSHSIRVYDHHWAAQRIQAVIVQQPLKLWRLHKLLTQHQRSPGRLPSTLVWGNRAGHRGEEVQEASGAPRWARSAGEAPSRAGVRTAERRAHSCPAHSASPKPPKRPAPPTGAPLPVGGIQSRLTSSSDFAHCTQLARITIHTAYKGDR